MKLELPPVVVLNRVSFREISGVKLPRLRRRERGRRHGVVVGDRDPLNFGDSVENSLKEFRAHAGSEWRNQDQRTPVIGGHLKK